MHVSSFGREGKREGTSVELAGVCMILLRGLNSPLSFFLRVYRGTIASYHSGIGGGESGLSGRQLQSLS